MEIRKSLLVARISFFFFESIRLSPERSLRGCKDLSRLYTPYMGEISSMKSSKTSLPVIVSVLG